MRVGAASIKRYSMELGGNAPVLVFADSDLDLDVIRTGDGTVFVDDEDEFAEHRVSLAYPERWVDQARVTAARARSTASS